MSDTMQTIVAGSPPLGGDTGRNFANKINTNFNTLNNSRLQQETLLTQHTASINTLNSQMGTLTSTVNSNYNVLTAKVDPLVHSGKIAIMNYSNEFIVDGMGESGQTFPVTTWDSKVDEHNMVQRIGSYWYFKPPTGAKYFRFTCECTLDKSTTGGSRVTFVPRIDSYEAARVDIFSGDDSTFESDLRTSNIISIGTQTQMQIEALIFNLNSLGDTTYRFTGRIEEMSIEISR